ncbi:MAG: arginine--tRNA ligase [Candidatus Micrarchaeia archaeon]
MWALEAAQQAVGRLVAEGCAGAGWANYEREALASVQEAKEPFGDLTSTIAFGIAKKEGKNPLEVASAILAKIPPSEFVEKVECKGPYINFFLSAKFWETVLREAGQKDYGRGRPSGKKFLVEWPSVNPNKPWHAGHLRNAVLGDCVARLLEFAGHTVERQDYIDDLGLQVAQSVWGYLKINRNIVGKADHWLGAEYVEVARRFGEEPMVEKAVREILKSMEEGNNEIARQARSLCEKCVVAQYQTAFNLGIYHDVLVWESDIVRSGLFEKGLKLMLERGAAVKEESGKNAGCIVAKLEGLPEFAGMESPDKVLVRADGTATYTGKDVAFQMWKFGLLEADLKFKEFLVQPNGKRLFSSAGEGERKDFGKADVVVNVIGAEQIYPQKVIAAVLRRAGFTEQADNSVHLAYEHATLPDEKFSGRAGTWMGYTADEIIEEAVKRARKEVRERFKDMGEEEKEGIARAVGIGAVKFGFVRLSPEKKLIFSWEEALSFEGDAAPYIQYAHARATRMLEKAGGEEEGFDVRALGLPEERRLLRLLAKFPLEAARAARDYRPHYICDYLLGLADAFGKFYDAAPVLKAEKEERAARLALVRATKNVLAIGLGLLGIEAPERM